MPRGSLNIAMTEASLPQQQHKLHQHQHQQQHQQQPPLREYLVKAEMWYKNPNASRKTNSAKGRTKEKRESYGPTPPPTAPPEDTTGFFFNKLRERPSWMSKVVISASNSATTSASLSAGSWRPVICKLVEDGPHSTLSIYGDENMLAHSVHVQRLTSTDIRTADRSLFFRHDVLGIHCTPGSGMSSTNWQDPIYLAFQTQEAHNTWLVLLRSYANPEVYGRMIAVDQGGLYRMWRQIELFVLQGRNLGVRPKTPEAKRLGSRAGRRKDREREERDGSEDDEATATATAGTTSGMTHVTSSGHHQSIPGDNTSATASSDTEHDLFCEVALDNVVSGRTTVKYRTNAPDWFESFMFRDLPGFGTMHVNVWRDRKLFGPSLIGAIEISLANFRRGEFVEGWWPVFSPTGNGTQVGEVKLRMRVDEEIILPSQCYNRVLESIEEQNYLDVLADLEQKLRLEHVSHHVISLAMARRRLVPDLSQLADREVAMLNGSTFTLFRGNSVFTKAMEFTMRFYGRSFLDASVGPVIRRLCNERVEIKLDPSSHAISQLDQERPRSSGRDGAVDATRTLGYWCNEFWNQIYYVRTECPIELRVLFKHIRTSVEERFGRQSNNSPWQGISAFCFLRFIVPAILYPNMWGIYPGLPSEGVQRSLKLVAKTLQNLANLMITTQKEEYMRGMSGFVAQNIPAMIDYLDAVSTVPDDFTLQSNSASDGSLMYSQLSGPDKTDRMQVVASIRARLENNDEIPMLHKDAIPLLPHLLDVPKHLAIITSAVVRNAKSGAAMPYLSAMSSRGPTQSSSREWDLAHFAELCFDVEAQALKSVATLASGAARTWKSRSISSALQNALNASSSSANVVAPLPARPSSSGLGASLTRTRKISTDSWFRGMHQHPVAVNADNVHQQGDTPPVSPTIAFIPMTRSVSDAMDIEPVPPVPSIPPTANMGSSSGSPLSPSPPTKRRKNPRPSTAPGSTTASQSTLFSAGVILRPNDSQYRQYREQTIAAGGTTSGGAFSANSLASDIPTPSRRPMTSRESSWAASSYRKPVPAYTSSSTVAADATLREQRPGASDERVRPEKEPEKERSRSSFIKLPFSDDKKSSRKRPPSVVATAPMPSLASLTTISTHGASVSLRGAFGDTTNMNTQVGLYPPVMVDEKMYIGKDLSAGGTIGNIGLRRTPAGSATVQELYRARTHEERGVKKKRNGFFAWLRKA